MRKATLASILRKSRPRVRLNQHLEYPAGDVVFQHACKLGLEGIVSKHGITLPSGRSPDWIKMKNPNAPAVKREGRRIGDDDPQFEPTWNPSGVNFSLVASSISHFCSTAYATPSSNSWVVRSVPSPRKAVFTSPRILISPPFHAEAHHDLKNGERALSWLHVFPPIVGEGR